MPKAGEMGLSEAMAFGKPVIVTGYSGNMDFMDETNSYPVPFVMEPVSELMLERIPLFTKNMRWARPDLGVMADMMVKAARGDVPAGLAERAAVVTRRFGPDAVARRLADLLERNGGTGSPS